MSNVCLVIDNNTIQQYLNSEELLKELKKQFSDAFNQKQDSEKIKSLLGSIISQIPGNNQFSAYNRHRLPTPEELLQYLKYREQQIEKNKEELELKRLNFEVFGQEEIITEKTELLTPIERRRRVLLISNLFSLYVRGRVTDVKKDPKKFNKTAEEAKIYSNIDAINDLGSTNIFNFIYNAIQTKANSVQNPEIKRKYEILLDKDVFSDLIEDVLSILEITEGVSSTIDEDSEKEESFKENWMVNFRESSSFSSMSKKVRRFINTIPKYNYKGEIVKDDLGFQEFLDPEYVHAFFIDKLRIMTSAEQLFPLLEKLSDSEPWVNTVITELKKQENEQLKSSFYQDFRKDFNNYSVQVITRRKNGSYSVESKLLNKPIGVYYLLENWRNNYQTGNILSDISIYNKDGSWNFEHAKELFNQTQEYFNSTSGYLTLEILEELNNKEDSEKSKFNKLLGFMNAAGISINKNILQSVLESKKPKKNEETSEYSGIDYVRLLLSDLQYIFKEVSNATPTTIVEEEHGITGIGTLNIYKDLINTFSTKYSSIAKKLAVVDQSAIEDNIRVGGKNIYTHTTPNYLGKLVKILNNSIELSEDEYKNTIEQEFGYDLWFKKTLKDPNGNDIEQWNNSIIADLLDPDIRKHFQHKIVLIRDNKEYSEWDSLDTSLLLLTEFENGIDSKEHNFTTCNIAIPVLADAQSAEFLQVRRYEFNKLYPYKGEYQSGKDVLLDKLYELALQEWDRIQRVRTRKQDPSIKEIANYDKRGLTFCFIEELNDYIPQFDQLIQNKDITTFEYTLKKAVKNIYDQKFKNFLKKQKDIGILDKTSDSSQYLYLDKTKYNTEEKAEQFLEEYFYNFSYSQSQIIQLVATDLAFYKDMDDFYKRIKEIHSPSLKLDTEATYNGVKVGRKYQNVLHVQDSVIVSEILSTLNTVLKEKVKQGILSQLDRDYIYNKFTQVNVADAQCLRSLQSYRDILIMGGRWDEPGVEGAYNNLLNGSWGIQDFMTIWQTLKPFNYTQRAYYNGEGNAKIKGGLQHKNSEFPLIALYAAITSPLAKSPQLQAFHKILNDPNLKIDCIQFESTTKVGKQGVLNIHNKGKFATGTININNTEYSFNNYDELETIVNNYYFKDLITKEQRESLLKPYQLNSADDIYNSIINAIKEDEDRGQVLQRVSFEDYGIQVENPEHIIDHVQLVGTQVRKLIASDIDMSDTDTIDVDGHKMTKQQWLYLYNAINTENIIDSFKEVDKIFSNPKEVERILQEEIASSPRYGKDLKEICTLDENGRFRIPLFDPIQSTRVQQLLNSVIRNRITSQKIRGGTCVQVSNFGLTDQLNIKFKTENGQTIDFNYYKKTHKSKNVSEQELKKEYSKWAKEQVDKGNLSVAYFECYMPAYSKQFYQPLMSYDKNGNPYLDINKLPEDLKKCVGYRIPTENKYSMAPLYIKGFLPQQNGSCIMLPADITVIAGSDFDIKLYWCH